MNMPNPSGEEGPPGDAVPAIHVVRVPFNIRPNRPPASTWTLGDSIRRSAYACTSIYLLRIQKLPLPSGGEGKGEDDSAALTAFSRRRSLKGLAR